MKRAVRLLLLAKAALVLGWAATPPGRAPAVLFNTSASLPVGLYRKVEAEPARGALVAACLPDEWAELARERRYVASGRRCPHHTAPVLKRIAAVASETVSYEDGAVVVNGAPLPSSALLPRDSHGRPMPVARAFPWVVQETEVLLLAEDRQSFDGRYFGPVDRANVLGVYEPWLLFSDR